MDLFVFRKNLFFFLCSKEKVRRFFGCKIESIHNSRQGEHKVYPNQIEAVDQPELLRVHHADIENRHWNMLTSNMS